MAWADLGRLGGLSGSPREAMEWAARRFVLALLLCPLATNRDSAVAGRALQPHGERD